MPYKCENIKLGQYDRRRKLTEDQKEEIKHKYSTGLYSHRTLAAEYKVDKSTIAIIVNPKRAEQVKQRIKEHWKDYVDREKLTAAQRKRRRYKQELFLEGRI